MSPSTVGQHNRHGIENTVLYIIHGWNGLCIVSQVASSHLFRMCIVQVQAYMQKVFHFVSDISACRQAFKIRLNHDTLVVQITQR